MDELEDEAEYQKFLSYLDYLTEQIFWLYATTPSIDIKDSWDEIQQYGLEPVFTDMTFDAIVAEEENK